jgi:hypothetical protein
MRPFWTKKLRPPPLAQPPYSGDFADVIRAAHFGPTAETFGNTMYPLDLPAFTRTEIEPLSASWSCEYCNCVNPPASVHCEHCGAPHTEKKEQQKEQGSNDALAQLRNLERLTLRMMSLTRRLTVQEQDEFEPDEDGESVLLG